MQSHLHTQISGATRAALGNERIFPMGKKKTIDVEVGRSAVSGRFTTVEKAERDKSHHVVETITRPVNTQKK